LRSRQERVSLGSRLSEQASTILAHLIAERSAYAVEHRPAAAVFDGVRKLLKRSYHTLRELGEEALQPA
jgi:hypothetical protein